MDHWICTNCGEVDGARAGNVCHGPRYTGICTVLGETVVEISPGAFKRLDLEPRAEAQAEARNVI